MRYVGVDLAWGAKNTTAAVVLEGGGDPADGAVLTAVADALTGDADILAFIAANDDGGGLLVAIDAPTRVPNAEGRRPCEAILSRCLRRQEAGAHPANRRLLAAPDGTVRGERLVAALEDRGIRHSPYLGKLPHPPRAAFEVFPHPAHVALFGLEKTLKYKAKPGRDRDARLADFRRYASLLAGLAGADPPLLLRDDEAGRGVRRDPAPLRPAALKHHEDVLDALTCAYVALYRNRWGDERCPVVGDMERGYIVTPATPAMRACFDQAAAQTAPTARPAP